jgi:hypothetical protein
MNAYDAMNIWSTDLIICTDKKNSITEKLYKLPSGDVHLFLIKYGYKIKYCYTRCGWIIKEELTSKQIKELKKIKSRLK